MTAQKEGLWYREYIGEAKRFIMVEWRENKETKACACHTKDAADATIKCRKEGRGGVALAVARSSRRE